MKDVIREIFPPDVPPTTRWRLAIFGAILILGLFQGGGYGVFSALGWAGFASAADLEERVSLMTRDVAGVREDVSNIKLQLVEQSLFDAKESECSATDSAARRFFSKRVLTLSREYVVLAQQAISIPPCRDGR